MFNYITISAQKKERMRSMAKKRILKKFATAALAAMMLLGTVSSAYAAETKEPTTAQGTQVGNVNKGSLTIHKYKMTDTQNAGASNTTSGGSVAEVPSDAEPLKGVSFLVTKVDENAAADTTWPAKEVVTGADGSVAISDLPLGRYKVEELGMLNGDGSDQVVPNLDDEAMKDGAAGSTAITSKVFYVDVPMTASDGETLNYDVHVYPKNEVLSIDKFVTYVDNKDDTFNMKEEQTWIINSTIPGNIARTKEDGTVVYSKDYVITDDLDTQLTYVKGQTVQVRLVDKNYNPISEDTLIAGTHYTLTVPTEDKGGTLKVELTDAGKALLKGAINRESNPAAYFQVRFKTYINETATPGEAIYNGAKLDFTNSNNDAVSVEVPDGKNSDGSDNPNEKDERPEVHTGKVAIKKIKQGDTNTVLPDVQFMIFSDAEKAEAAVKAVQNNTLNTNNVDGALEVWDGSRYTKVVTTGTDGIAKFIGLSYYTNKPTGTDGNVTQKGEDEKTGDNTFYIVETKAASGYQLPSEHYEVKVSQTISLDTNPSFVITNKETSILPRTGGRGTILFTAGGILLMSIAVVLLLISRKKECNNR